VRDNSANSRGSRPSGRAKWRVDDEPLFAKRDRHRRSLPPIESTDATDGLTEGDRWSNWDQPDAGQRGPQPYPSWLVTELAAVDTELGILKTGKEADVFLLRRGVPGTERSCLLAAKRYRGAEHRMFHRDSGYLEGRRVRESRAGRLVMIDLPQVVDVIANPQGAMYLDRDAANVGAWFTARGLTGVTPEPADLPALLRYEARLD
jgi:RIO kinase 1